ncbi:GNAT family N-acetyltransferase [Hahella sp. CCB-MM4]|uniref:GNAT family N-acetyltransferase n=1 Tax=Hahella sp. (strain CCB-MM4) TaxID=1926491 RepID=UPI000B9A4B53|nr:GNAT family N-acetyltransferase [Hahella sp. CCB-MM4]OZG75281.1 GNAT family N-acetyltransferase [Hahella sp. CCB-MM4]
MMTGIPLRLETDRLILRQFQEQDFESYRKIVSDPEVMRYVGAGKPLSAASAWQNLALVIGHWQLRGYGLWALELRNHPGLIIGRAGLYFPEGWPGLEIGWLLQRSAWGNGYATEAARAVKALAGRWMPELGLISLIHPKNHRSVRVAERLGGKLDDQIDLMQQSVNVFRYS